MSEGSPRRDRDRPTERPGGYHGPQSWVGDLSGRRATLTPDRVGLVDATTGRAFTYADLDRRATRTAAWLDEFGVRADRPSENSPTDSGSADAPSTGEGASERAGGRVAVVSRNRPEVVDLFFATGKTGGVLAPLSHRLAPPELAELLSTVDPQLVVVEEPFAGDVAAAFDHEVWTGDCPVRSLAVEAGEGAEAGAAEAGETTWQAVADGVPATTEYEGPDVAPGDPHLFLHTGGSTGTPKETVISHEAVLWNSLNTITAWGLRPDDVTPLTFPMFHTGGWNVITVPLFHIGGAVVIAREFDPGQVLSVVEDRGATVLVAVPAVLRMMVDHDRWAETDLSTLRFAKSGGGPCRESVMDAWWDREVDLSQGYGLTECGPNNFAMPEGWPREKADTVGVPNPHVDARVVDDGTECAPGEIGELQLRSPHAADRYWRAPEETAETFGSRAGDGESAEGRSRTNGWLSTGDLARVGEDGYVSIEGRKKNMYVSGGENVYPAEVEDAIADHPAVAEVVVVPVPDDQWGQVGKAVVETAGGEAEPLTAADLSEFLDERLARFKHPQHLAYVEEMPTSGPSKIDREAVAREFGE
ncbi:MAG: AMP-binding protein [Haloarculaceae archaeon]